MNRFSLSALACGAAALLLSGCGGGGGGLTLPAAQSSAIVFVSSRGYVNGQNQIYLMNADGSNQTRLTNSPEIKFSPYLSRDRKTIVFTSDPTSRSNPQGTQIFKMSADGTNVVQLTSNANGNYSPTISPDGKTIAWANSLDVWLMDINGNNQRLLAATDSSNIGPSPAFSSNGTLLAYEGMRNNRRVLIVRTLSNGNERVIDLTLPVPYSSGPLAPRFSPDGGHIIFSAIVSSGREQVNDVFLIKTDGSDAKTPTTVFSNEIPLGTPIFSPSGATLIYQTEGPETDFPVPVIGPQIATVDANTFGNKKILTTLGINYDPSVG